jgi:uncharacterized iron-regulated membrane protein
MKIFFRRIHLYLGLAVGLIVMTTCFTGAVLVFEEELQHLFHKQRYYMEAGNEKQPIEQLLLALKAKEPAAKVTRVQVFNDPKRSVVVNYQGGKFSQAFFNPYTGELIELYNHKDSFFYLMFDLHRWLLSGDTGKLIVGISTSVFLFILITGIILWWPRNKAILLQRLKVKAGAGWKRMNHDLHIVTGFYTAIFLFIFAFTGLAWSFQWFNNGIYKITNSPVKPPKPPVSVYQANSKRISIDQLMQEAKLLNEEVVHFAVNLPKDSVEPITIHVLCRNAIHETATNAIYLDQYTGVRIGKLAFAERSTGAKVRASFKPIHTGSIFGTPSKIIALIACICGTTFPITGVIMWLNRTRKKARQQKNTVELNREARAQGNFLAPSRLRG